MNLPQVHQLLREANEQPDGFLRLDGEGDDYEVRLMAAAGLVEITLSDGTEGSFTAISRITDLGKTVLRTFETPAVAAALRRSSE